MKAKHTPGPWELTGDPCHFDTLTSVRGGPSEIRGKGLKWRQLMVEIGGYADPATAEANARLIAAAPDLLEALQELLAAERANSLEIVGRDTDGHPLNAAGVARKKARAAIAKATGAA